VAVNIGGALIPRVSGAWRHWILAADVMLLLLLLLLYIRSVDKNRV
jgi:hypothetical protein